jgi:hypothetical protein
LTNPVIATYIPNGFCYKKKYDIKSLLDDLVSQIMKQIYQMSNK